MNSPTLRLAMWSGPRNISTAMMRSWGNRPDTAVWDEPLYACYLAKTNRGHPGAAEVIAHDETDCRKVIARILAEVPGGKPIFFHKQMAQHLLPEIDRGWLAEVTNCFLIRDPGEMLTSFVKQVPDVTLADTGLPQQVEIFEQVRQATGTIPPVLDARDVLQNPRAMLGRLCEAVGVPFREEMLSWPPGPRATDGIWAKYWYAAVEQSTSFHPYRPKTEPVPAHLHTLHEQCLEFYEQLFMHRLT